MNNHDLKQELQELTSAEDFLEYFKIPYDAKIVQVNRLHILQRFHDYLEREQVDKIQDNQLKYRIYTHWLNQAYQDFVHSNAQTEKVFQVFHRQMASEVFIPVENLFAK
jgi:nitrogenase-stabilizing/protective protein